MAIITNAKEREALRMSGKILVQVLERVASAVKPGVTTKQLDKIAREELKKNGGEPAFLHYQPSSALIPFPAVICISINEEVVHGIPGEKTLYEGDIISLDFGVKYQGMFTDCAITMPVGNVAPKTKTLLATTYKGLSAGIRAARAGKKTGDIGHAVESVANEKNYGVIRTLIGHGVGHAVHEEPPVPNYGKKGTGHLLKENLVIAIEPMFTLGSHHVEVMSDGWTITTADDSLSAHFEQTVRITPDGTEIITPFTKKLLTLCGLSE